MRATRRRALSGDHDVYWPAFADLLTALVVVLLSTFAVISKAPRDAAQRPVSTAEGHGSNEGLPQAEWQYESEILMAKRELLLPNLLRVFRGRVARGEWLEIRLCAFESGAISEDEIRECRESVRLTADTIAQSTFLKGIEEKYSVVLAAFYLRARTGSGNPSESAIKTKLSDAKEYFMTKGGIVSGRMNEEQYIERGNRRGSEISLVFSGRLRETDHKTIHDHWTQKDWDWLKDFKLRSSSADPSLN